MRILSAEEIKACELDILRAFVSVCEKEGYYYTLAYGTLIGAIRHKGFVPWDDDIDVFMPRPDYERFWLKYGKDGISQTLKLRGPHNGGETSFTKLVDMSTRSTSEDLLQSARANDHLWIDIFPLDGMPKSELVAGMRTLFVKMVHKLVGLVVCKPRQDRSWLRRQNRKIFKRLFFWLTASGVSRLEDRMASRYSIDGSPVIGNFLYGGYERCRRFPKPGFMKPMTVPFESLMVTVPSNYDKILTMGYGDYMKLPPADQRVTHQLHVEVDG